MGSDEQSGSAEAPGGLRDSLPEGPPGDAGRTESPGRVGVDGRTRARERSAIATIVLLLALASPLRFLWAAPSRPWWLIFVLWVGAVVLGLWLARPLGGRGREP